MRRKGKNEGREGGERSRLRGRWYVRSIRRPRFPNRSYVFHSLGKRRSPSVVSQFSPPTNILLIIIIIIKNEQQRRRSRSQQCNSNSEFRIFYPKLKLSPKRSLKERKKGRFRQGYC